MARLLVVVALMAGSVHAQPSPQFTTANIEELYLTGVKAYDDHNWARAIVVFEKVVQQAPNFRDARTKLKNARHSLELQSFEAVLAEYYARGEAAMTKGDLQTAHAFLSKIYSVRPEYLDTASRLGKIREALVENAAATASNSANMDSIYQAALTLMAREKWSEAAGLLRKIDSSETNYRYVNDLLITANMKLQAEAAIAAKENRPLAMPLFGRMFALSAIVVVPAVCIFALSPVMRARYHSFRGDYAKAAGIYERLLARQPLRLKLYPVLGSIYLLQGRHDARALRVYEITRQHKLAGPKNGQIDSRPMLEQANSDQHPLEVLEKSLQMKRRA
jgi:outer membrane protein assembly factor BamD (BamD/ComL family)